MSLLANKSEGLLKSEYSNDRFVNSFIEHTYSLDDKAACAFLVTDYDDYTDLVAEIRTLKLEQAQKGFQDNTLNEKLAAAERAYQREIDAEIDVNDRVALAATLYDRFDYDIFSKRFHIALPNVARIHRANEALQKYATQNGCDPCCVDCRISTETFCGILGISELALQQLEELVDIICFAFNVDVCYQFGGTKVDACTYWDLKPAVVKNKVYGILKRIMWTTFRFRVPLIALIIRRYSYKHSYKPCVE